MVLLPLVWVFFGCGSNTDNFIGARVLDPCNGSWPVCNGYASCILGPESYTEGNFPGEGNIIVQTLTSSTVTLSFLFSNLTAAGGQFSMVFYEPGCTANVTVDVDGPTVAEESQALGVFARSAPLNVAGYHLVTYQATTNAFYYLKVDIDPNND